MSDDADTSPDDLWGLTPGNLLGAYQLQNRLASDGVASLWVVESKQLRKQYLLTVLHPSFSGIIGLSGKVGKWVNRLKSKTHPHVLTPVDHELIEGRVCILSEFRTVTAISENVPMGGDQGKHKEATVLALQVLGALSFLQEQEIFFPNFTPHNILMDDSGHAFLWGMGLLALGGSKLLKNLSAENVEEATEESIQSLDVLSIKFKKKAEPGALANIYAFGCSFYFLLTGKRADESNYLLPSSVGLGIDESWDYILGKCLQVRDRDRYQGIKEIRNHLQDDVLVTSLIDDAIRNPFVARKKVEKSFQGAAEKKRSRLLWWLLLLLLVGAATGGYYYYANEQQKEADRLAQIQEEADRLAALKEKQKAEAEALLGELRLGSLLPFTVSIWSINEEEQILPEQRVEGVRSFVHVLPEGEYVLRLLHEDAYPIRQEVLVKKGEPLVLALEWQMLPGQLSVSSSIEGVQVWLNDERQGVTPLQLSDIASQQSHVVSLRHPLYVTQDFAIELAPQAKESLEVSDWERKMGRLAFRFSIDGTEVPADELFEVIVNGELRGGATEPVPVETGTYGLQVKHPYYEDFAKKIDVQHNQTNTLEVDLVKRPCQLELRWQKKVDYQLMINGKRVSSDTDVFPLLPDQVNQLELTVPHAYIMKKELTLLPGKNFVWEVEPRYIESPVVGENYVMPYTNLQLVWIEPGSVKMGSHRKEGGHLSSESPQTEVALTQGFWMGAYELSVREYAFQVSLLPAGVNKVDDTPVRQLTWQQAVEFCEALTASEAQGGRLPEGYVYRLPTEAEWEYACRAGTTTPFAFGEVLAPGELNTQGSYPRKGSERFSPNAGQMMPSQSGKANGWGLYHMHGNLEEWTLDGYRSRLPGGSLAQWSVIKNDKAKTVRGGSFRKTTVDSRSASRASMLADTKSDTVGVRVVLAPVLE